uniref:rRNA (cytosine-C(5))-methyltransferase NOP2C isoform X2 n=1 Tax=Erigeron canadensis TaxID=72917 RepID=UPI001CB9D5F5|nr:rRNA (cytosine-C(5))-methyltransferase NOP2C isoform X2 [Erigeron canadensis]
MKRGRVLVQVIKISNPRSFSSQTSLHSHFHSQIVEKMDESERYCYNPILRWNPQVEDYFNKVYGPEAFSRISKALTRPSCYSCIRVNTLRTTTEAIIEKIQEIQHEKGTKDYLKNLHTNDNTTVEISESLNGSTTDTGPVLKCPIPGLDYVVFVKGSGPHDIQYEYQQGRPPKEIIVSRKCAEAVLRGAQVYIPGILACSAHVEVGDKVAVSVGIEQPGRDGGWAIGITRGIVLQGLKTDPQYLEREGLYIGQGITTMSRAGIFRDLSGLGVDMTERVFRLTSFNELLKGDIFLQNLPSIITAHVLDPQQGERILDMCAAPGGKTTAIASLMKDKGQVIAVDRSHNKVLEIHNLAAELGLNSIRAFKLDALKSVNTNVLNGSVMQDLSEDKVCQTNQAADSACVVNINSSSSIVVELKTDTTAVLPVSEEVSAPSDDKFEKGRYTSKHELRKQIRRLKNGPGRNQATGGRVDKCEGFAPNSFDRVLLDAPCSALGLRPRLFAGEETVESLRKHGKYQKRMFDQAVQLVRPGGVLVYSTCTINPGENEGVVRYALDTYKFLSLAPQHPRIGGPGLVGHEESSDGHLQEWLRPGEADLVQRFDPSGPYDTIGFFIAKFNVGPKDNTI